jgi:hypothetical protein
MSQKKLIAFRYKPRMKTAVCALPAHHFEYKVFLLGDFIRWSRLLHEASWSAINAKMDLLWRRFEKRRTHFTRLEW